MPHIKRLYNMLHIKRLYNIHKCRLFVFILLLLTTHKIIANRITCKHKLKQNDHIYINNYK